MKGTQGRPRIKDQIASHDVFTEAMSKNAEDEAGSEALDKVEDLAHEACASHYSLRYPSCGLQGGLFGNLFDGPRSESAVEARATSVQPKREIPAF
jgi:hypothetical protein